MPPKATRSSHRRHSLEPQALEDVSKREVKKRRSFRSSSEAAEDEHVAVGTKTEITFTSYKEGFLKKRSMNSSLWHSWKVRYFLLIDGGLMYYKTAVDARGQGYVRIGPTSRCHESDKYDQYGFVLKGVQNDLHMIADSRKEMDEWISAIDAQIEASLSKSLAMHDLDADAVAEGEAVPDNGSAADGGGGGGGGDGAPGTGVPFGP